MTRRHIARSYYSGHPLDVPAVIAALEACVTDSSGDPMPPINEPDEPVVSQRDLDERAEKDYERWLDRDDRRCA